MLLNLFILTGLISFVQGKDCAELSKPHQTRCDMYFKCVELPSKSQAWVPTKCNRGLIYETNLKICVVPDINWECTLGDENDSTKTDDNNVYGINNLDYLNKEIQSYRPKYDVSGERIPSGIDKQTDDGDSVSDEKIVIVNGEDNNNENNIEIIDGYIPTNESEKTEIYPNDTSDDVDYSGDGSDDNKNHDVVEKKETYIAIPVNSDPDSSVASHLQRLSQLIQSLKDSQLNKSQSYDLGPNELNNFLAHHNIKVEYNDQLKNQVKKQDISLDGRIHPDHLSEILDLQQKLQSLNSINDGYSTTTSNPVNKYPDTTKIQIKSPAPLKNIRITDPGYSTSQIVVNRPEGSVLFSLPSNTPAPIQSQYPQQPQYPPQFQYPPTQSQYPPQSQYPHQSQYTHQSQYPPAPPSEPYISEDTLKTVLELSKQMMSSSNHQQAIQNYIPDQNYLQPIFRPVYYNIPIPIINNYEKKEPKHGDKDQDTNGQPHYEKISSVSGFIDTTPKYQISDDNDQTTDEHSTIIHNHIPITIENPFQPQNKKSSKVSNTVVSSPPIKTVTNVASPPMQFNDYKPQAYPDSYNNRPLNYQPYPPFNEGAHNSYMSYLQEQQLPETNPSYTNMLQYAQPNEPSGSYYQQQGQPYQQQYFQEHQGPPTSGFPHSVYTQQTHLNDNNVNHFVNFNKPQYPTLRPASLSSLTTTDPMYTYQNQVLAPTPKYEPINTYQDFASFDDNNSDQQELNNDADTDTQTNDEENVDDYDNTANEDYDTNEEDNIAANINENNVMNLLADLENKKIPVVQNKQLPERAPINQFLMNANDDSKKKVVQFGDNFLSIDEYERLVQPLMDKNALNTDLVEFIPCVTGARQPLARDCTKYIVCNGETKKVLTYSCPSYTGFNQQTRFCDAKTFGICKRGEMNVDKVSHTVQDTINANKILQIKADKELQQAQRDREQALKTQQLTALIKQQTQNILNSSPSRPLRNRRKKIKLTTSTARPYYRTRPTTKRKKNRPIIRRIPCREPSKVADSLSIFNYFNCYRGPDGKLTARKMTCPAGLVFCERIKLCTSTTKCGS